MENFDVGTPVRGALTTAHKALAAFLSFVGTYAGVLVADINEAAGWVNQLIVVVGGAVGTAWVYFQNNRPKR